MSKHVMIAVLLLGSTAFFTSCDKDKKDDSKTSEPFDQKGMLSNIANQVIIPDIEAFKSASSQLENQVIALVNTPSNSNFSTAQSAFVSAYNAYQKVAFYNFGPANNLSLISNTNTYPTDTANINTSISQGSTDIASASRLDEKGFPALDYLLFYAAKDSVISRLNHDVNYANYIKVVVSDIATTSSSLHNEWVTSGGNYVSTFIESTGTDQGSALGLFFNAYTQYLERNLRDGKIAIPNGERSFTKDPLPQLVEAPYYNTISLELAKTSLHAMQHAFNGGSGQGLDDMLNHIEADIPQKLSDDINAQFDEVDGKLNGLTPPLSTAVEQQNAAVSEVFQSFQKLVVLIKTDAASQMGILITYQDNDGD